MNRVPDYPDEKGARCAVCNRPMTVPNIPGDGWVCDGCTERAEDDAELRREIYGSPPPGEF